MNNSELESILKNESLDVLQKIYDYMAEDLSLISEQDKLNLENVNNEMEEKFKILKQEFKTLDESKKNNISKVINDKAYNNTKITTATAPKAWRQYFIAFPDSYGWVMKNAKDGNNIDCTVSKAGNVTITYGSGDTAVDVVHRVYYINNAADYGTLKISWTLA